MRCATSVSYTHLTLPTQWSFAEDAAKESGAVVDRGNWRIVMSWHIAETRELAKEQAKDGLYRWHNEYTVGTLQRPGAEPFANPDDAVEQTAFGDLSAAVIGTPDDLIKAVQDMLALTGGFGTVIGFVHDWANPENTRNSWDMVARYVVPEVNGLLSGYRESQRHVIENRDSFDRAGQAVLSKIMENEKAAAAMAEEAQGQAAIPSHHAPDLSKAQQ